MTTVSLSIDALERCADTRTDLRLLPVHLQRGDNSTRLEHCKIALLRAIDFHLTPMQRRCIRLHYWQGMRKSEIAAHIGVTCSAVSKAVKSAEEILREHVELYLQIYDSVLQELRSEWELG